MELEPLQQLRELSADDLRQRAGGIRKELFSLRVHQVSGRIERPSQFRALRRQLARVLTLLNAQAGAAPQPAAPMDAMTGKKKRGRQ
ncbi:MAG: 50S ribosomal protein L29 [Nitrospirae bacterium]|nr:50S ribosomal protein L29 [Nitrospirota bacterium]